jgi:hypothetical protein
MSWHILRHYPNMSGGTEENYEHISQDIRYAGRGTNLGLPEYEAGVPATAL